MDPGLLDVLHHAADEHLAAVAQRVDVDLDGVVEEPVDEHRPLRADRRGPRDVAGQRRVVVDDLHAAPAEHVRRPHQHRVADPLGDRLRVVERGRGAERRRRQARLPQHLTERPAVLRQVDRGRGRPDHRDTRRRQPLREPERGLPAELHDHPGDGPGLLLGVHDLEHVLEGQRLEVEAVRGVVVRGDGLRVAVDHHGLEPGRRATPSPRARTSSRTRCPARSGSAPTRGSAPSAARSAARSPTRRRGRSRRRCSGTACGRRTRRRRCRRSCRPAGCPAGGAACARRPRRRTRDAARRAGGRRAPRAWPGAAAARRAPARPRSRARSSPSRGDLVEEPRVDAGAARPGPRHAAPSRSARSTA